MDFNTLKQKTSMNQFTENSLTDSNFPTINLILVIVCLGLSYSMIGQNTLAYQMDNLTNNQSLTKPIYSNFYLQLPSLQSSTYSSSVSLDNLGLIGTEPLALFDFDRLKENLLNGSNSEDFKPNNLYFLENKIDILGVGWSVKNTSISVNLSDHTYGYFNYPKDLVTWSRTAADVNNHVETILSKKDNFYDWSNLKFNVYSYAKIGLGITQKINSSLTIGLRFNYLLGRYNLWTDNDKYTIEGSYAINDKFSETQNLFKPTYSTNGVLQFNSTNLHGFDYNYDNYAGYVTDYQALIPFGRGISVDLGIRFCPIEDLAFSINIHNVGFIKWSGDAIKSTITAFDDFSTVHTLFSSIKTELGRDANLISYQTPTLINTYISLEYHLGQANYIALTAFLASLENDILLQSYAFTYRKKVKKWVEFVSQIKYTTPSFSYGAGVVLNLSALQLHVLSENIRGLTKETVNHKNIQLGFSLTFGRNHKKRSVYGIK